MSWRKTTLCRENDIVGPWGKWDSVKAVGVPRCSWRRMISESPDAWADVIRLGKMRFPRFRRIEVGINNLISFAKAESLDEGSLEVVISTLGSTIPES